jgi:putative ABC transport system ATP-binding protein
MENGLDAYLFETNAISKSYDPNERGDEGKGKAHGIAFSLIRIPRGGVISLVGESGTGKTTLFNLLGGLDEPDREDVEETPRILLDFGDGAVDIAADPNRFPRDRVGFVFQSGFLLHNASAGLNLALPRAQQGRSTDRSDLAQRLGSLDLPPEEIDKRAWKFSGGEAQRIAFVRALAHDPLLVFADEPTSNVDYRKALFIMGQLREWVRNPAYPGRTVLWITHDLRLAAAIADAVLVLHRDNRDGTIQPVCLPGSPEMDLEARTAALERWSYSRDAMITDEPPLYRGLASDARPLPASPRPRLARRLLVKADVVRKLGLSEVFSRRTAQRSEAVLDHVNPVLSVAGAPPGRRGLVAALAAWLRSFGQWSSVLALALIMVLGSAGLSIYWLVDAHFERSVNDPRNCHLIVKTARAQRLDRGSIIRRLSERPWRQSRPETGAMAATIPSTFEAPVITPRATCQSGDAAYGRRDARGWGIAMARDGVCPSVAQTHVRLLTADEYEPIWTQVKLISGGEAQGVDHRTALADYLDAQFAANDSIFLSADKAVELIEGDIAQLIGREVCLIDPTWPETVKLKIKGIVDEVPSWQQNRFAGYIPNYTYDAFSHRVGLIQQPTHIALYFSSADVDEVEDYLRLGGYSFVSDNLDKIRRLIASSTVFKGIVTGFLGLVGLLLGVLTAMSVQSYLDANAQSFALLKAFGMSWGLIYGILLVEIGVGWLIAAALVAVGLFVTDLVGGTAWIRFDGLSLSADTAWVPYLAAAGGVWLLSALVSLVMTLVWWWRNRYVAQVLKAG